MSHPKQRITAAGIPGGRIRCGVALKELLPKQQQLAFKIVHRGITLECKWDPRDGPDPNRSGVLSIGKASLQQLLKADDMSTLEVIDGLRIPGSSGNSGQPRQLSSGGLSLTGDLPTIFK